MKLGVFAKTYERPSVDQVFEYIKPHFPVSTALSDRDGD
jgi:hypothetical protein